MSNNELADEFGAILDTLDHAIRELDTALASTGQPTYGVRAIQARLTDDLATLALIATNRVRERADQVEQLPKPVQCVACGKVAAWLHNGTSYCHRHVPSAHGWPTAGSRPLTR